MKSLSLGLIVGLFSVACFESGTTALDDPSAYPPMVMGDALVFFEPTQSSLFILLLDDPTREWCLIGEDGREVDNPACLTFSKGSTVSILVSSNLGV